MSATIPRPRRARLPLLLLGAVLLGSGFLGSCALPRTTRPLHEPTVRIDGPEGTELGVNTDYGILFLGRHTRAGKVSVTAWFGDGPNIETTVVEPVGGGLYTAETEIRLPQIPLTFVDPPAGTPVTLIGRRAGQPWSVEARIVVDERVERGLLLDLGPSSMLSPDQVGAPVIVRETDGDWRCLGIVSGRLRLTDEDGAVEYFTVLGPESTWRLVAHRRDIQQRRRWVYREDVL